MRLHLATSDLYFDKPVDHIDAQRRAPYFRYFEIEDYIKKHAQTNMRLLSVNSTAQGYDARYTRLANKYINEIAHLSTSQQNDNVRLCVHAIRWCLSRWQLGYPQTPWKLCCILWAYHGLCYNSTRVLAKTVSQRLRQLGHARHPPISCPTIVTTARISQTNYTTIFYARHVSYDSKHSIIDNTMCNRNYSYLQYWGYVDNDGWRALDLIPNKQKQAEQSHGLGTQGNNL